MSNEKENKKVSRSCIICNENEWINNFYKICLGCIIKEEIEQKKEEVMYNEL